MLLQLAVLLEFPDNGGYLVSSSSTRFRFRFFIDFVATPPFYTGNRAALDCSLAGLLRRALHALATATHLVLVVVHAVGALGTGVLQRVHALELEVLGHGIGRRNRLRLARRENRLESLDLLCGHGGGLAVLVGGALDGCGELDVELDVKVAVVVVAV